MFFNNCKINTHNVKNEFYNFSNDVVINKHNTINTNGTYNVTKINKTVHFNVASYFTKELEHTSNITNTIARHNRINCEHNVIKKVNKHINHINNYDTGVNHYSEKSLKKNYYYNFNDNCNFRK